MKQDDACLLNYRAVDSDRCTRNQVNGPVQWKQRCKMLLLVYSSVMVLVASSSVLSQTERRKAAEMVFSQAVHLFEQGDFQGALERFEIGMRIDGKDSAAHYFLAQTYEQMGDRAKALEHYRLSAEYGPQTEYGIIAGVIIQQHDKKLEAVRAQEEAAKRAKEEMERQAMLKKSQERAAVINKCDSKIEKRRLNIRYFYGPEIEWTITENPFSKKTLVLNGTEKSRVDDVITLRSYWDSDHCVEPADQKLKSRVVVKKGASKEGKKTLVYFIDLDLDLESFSQAENISVAYISKSITPESNDSILESILRGKISKSSWDNYDNFLLVFNSDVYDYIGFNVGWNGGDAEEALDIAKKFPVKSIAEAYAKQICTQRFDWWDACNSYATAASCIGVIHFFELVQERLLRKDKYRSKGTILFASSKRELDHKLDVECAKRGRDRCHVHDSICM